MWLLKRVKAALQNFYREFKVISVSVIEWFFQILLAIGRELESVRFIVLLRKHSVVRGERVSGGVTWWVTTEFKPCKEGKRKQTKKARLGRKRQNISRLVVLIGRMMTGVVWGDLKRGRSQKWDSSVDIQFLDVPDSTSIRPSSWKLRKCLLNWV